LIIKPKKEKLGKIKKLGIAKQDSVKKGTD
jgi:hypothetical protein